MRSPLEPAPVALDRPTPIGITSRGRKFYSTLAIRQYRQAAACSQEQVAERLGTAQNYVSRLETCRDDIVTEEAVLAVLGVIDEITAERAAIVAEGLAEIAARAER